MANFKVHIDIETLTLGEMEQLETGKVRDMLAVFDKRLQIDGLAQEDVPAVIREWTLADLREISEAIGEQVQAETDPVRKGKN